MQRNGSSNNIADNFSYNYYTNTNKVQRVTGSVQQFTYDLNGNVTGDSLNHLYGFKYDYRNLITEFRRWEQISTSKGTVTNAYKINYFYDEAGNRVKKALYKWQGSVPIPEEGDAGGTFNLLSVNYYVRDVSGKEIAIYTDAGSGVNLDQWNVYGLDNIGKIDPSNHRFMYLKDHLGSVRAIIDTTNTVVYAQDYDPWGYPLENRTYDAGVLTNSKYKFTAKERDKESGLNGGDGYDYFGARYYNSRIANWTSTDPLLEKHFDYSPYNYVLRSPLILYDPDGKQNRVNALSEGEGMPYELPMARSGANDFGYGGELEATNRIIEETLGESVKGTSAEGTFGEETFGSTRAKLTWVVEETKGSLEELGIENLHGQEVTQENLESLQRGLKGFTNDIPNEFIKYNESTGRVRVGDINKFGREVRIGKDPKTHNYEHIDIERNAPGKKFKDLQIKIYTDPIKF